MKNGKPNGVSGWGWLRFWDRPERGPTLAQALRDNAAALRANEEAHEEHRRACRDTLRLFADSPVHDSPVPVEPVAS